MRGQPWAIALCSHLIFVHVVLLALPVHVKAQSAGSGWQSPMRLGLETTPERSNRAANAVRTPIDKCRKWRHIASRLGETYAGVRLRQSVVERVCAFADQATDPLGAIWAWPWSTGGLAGELPPRLRGSFGRWTINCGAQGRRERCALLHEGFANAGLAAADSERIRVITHFVIDDVGGQERILWRVFVERPDNRWYASGTGAEGVPTNVIRYRMGSDMLSKRFDGCSVSGCLMEAEIGMASKVATGLWDGRPLDLDVRPTPGVLMVWQVPANGFKAGLRELNRLRQSEARLVAGR